jgi:hypothetical protein
MIWKTYNNNISTIKNMPERDIYSALHYLDNTNQKAINGFSTPFWIMSFEKELNYRKELERTIINALPQARWFNEEYNKVIYNIKYKEDNRLVYPNLNK